MYIYNHKLYCYGAYDTLSEIGRESADLSDQGVEVKWRLIVQRTYAMLQFYNQRCQRSRQKVRSFLSGDLTKNQDIYKNYELFLK